MDLKNRKAYMDAIFERYRQALKESKTRILNELCEVCGYHRKYAIAKINHWWASQGEPKPRQRRSYKNFLFCCAGRMSVHVLILPHPIGVDDKT